MELFIPFEMAFSWFFYLRIIRHPEYSARTKKNDIALIQLVRRIQFSETKKPVCLETDTSDVDSNIELTVTGWGVDSLECK